MKFWRVAIFLGFAGPLFFSNSTATLAVPKLLDNTAVIVNKGVILESDIQALVKMVKVNMGQNEQSLPDEAILYRQARENLIMESIQLQIAEKMGIQLSEYELEQGVAQTAQHHQLTLDQLRQKLIAQGVDYLQYREQFRREMLANKVCFQQVRPRINILPQEVEELVKKLAHKEQQNTEFELRHILLALPESPTMQQFTQTEKLAQQLILQLKQGADFSRLAITHSNDAQALKGGKLGWAKLEALPTLFAEKLQGAQKGSLIGPFRTGVGLHILLVDNLRSPENRSALELHARHILLKPSAMMSDRQAEAKLQQMAQQIRQRHKKFEELARRYSQDVSTAAQGGDLKWTNPAIYGPEFAKILNNLKPYQLSQPVRTTHGWHLIERLGIHPNKFPEEAWKKQAMQMILDRKLAEESQNWLQGQRAAAYIKILNSDQ